MLNLIACGLVIKPVPIEPAEKAKHDKKNMLIKIMHSKIPAIYKENELAFQIKEENDTFETNKTSFNSLLNLNRVEDNLADKYNNQLQRKFSYSVDHLQIPKYRVKQKINMKSSLNTMALVLGSQNIHIDVIDKTEITESIKKKSFIDKAQSLVDFSLFTNIIFMFFAASNFLTSLGD